MYYTLHAAKNGKVVALAQVDNQAFLVPFEKTINKTKHQSPVLDELPFLPY